MTMKSVALAVVLITAAASVFAQAKVRKLPTSINHPSLNVYAPYLSADGNAIVFVSDNAEDRVLTPFYSFRNRGDWNEPRTFPAAIYSRLNFLYGFSLDREGKTLFYSTLKSPGVGGFDIWMAEWQGSGWSAPTNPGMPLNSKVHDACVSVTPDGTTLYFMRCESMNQKQASNCKILKISRRSNGTWGEAEELPEHINNGNAQTPRIMPDGQTLIFSSDKVPGGKGGMDLYMTQFLNGAWSDPVPLDFANTEGNDQYVTATAIGRYLVRDAMGERRNEIVEYLFPDHLRPKGMTKLTGTVKDADGNPARAYISVIDTKSGDRYYSGRPEGDGSFFVYLREGGIYEVAVDPENDRHTFHLQTIDLSTGDIPQVQRLAATIKPLEEGDVLDLTMFSFAPFSSDVVYEGSPSEWKRFMRMINANADLTLEVQVLMDGYRQDSIRSDPDLTEVRIDSTVYIYDEIDSLGQLFQKDTVIVSTTWHNDRTWEQAEAIAIWLAGQGIDQDRLTFFANAIPATIPGEKKVTIRAQVRRKEAD